MHSVVVSLLLSLVATVLLLQCAGAWNKHLVALPNQLNRDPNSVLALPIGGVAIMLGLCGGVFVLLANASANTAFWWCGLSALLPLFIAGSLDDFAWRPSLLRRAAVTGSVSTALILTLDLAAAATPLGMLTAVVFVVAFIVAVTHSVGAADSRNGAAAMCSLLIHAALAHVAYSVGDRQIMLAALMVIGALLGVSFFSFQTNLARLGHSGCALAGFSTAALSVSLTVRHAEVSALFAVVLCSHSVVEAASAWKRSGLAGLDSVNNVDNRVPSLLYHRLVRWATGNPPDRRRPERDTSVLPHLWMLSVASIVPALLWWQHTAALAAALVFRLALQWAVSRLLDLPQPDKATASPPLAVSAPQACTQLHATEIPAEPGFFLSSTTHRQGAESGSP